MLPVRAWLSLLLLFVASRGRSGAVTASTPCIAVAGSQIRARDLSRVIPLFASLPEDTVLALAPAPGARRLLRPPMLEAIAARQGISLASPLSARASVRNPGSEICIERVAAVVREVALREVLDRAVKEALPDDRVQIELLDFSRYPVPEGPLEFSPAGLAVAGVIRPEQPVIWKGCVRDPDSRRSVPVWARVRLITIRPALEAVALLPPGRPLSAAQLRLVDRKTFAFTKPPLAQADQVIGLVPKRLLRPGDILRSEDLMPRREVEAGDPVSISVSAGALELKLPGKAESGGTLGDGVAVTTATTGRRFRATVAGPARVRVEARQYSTGQDPDSPEPQKESKQ